ncbi:ABC transporter permease [Mesorhizobium sp. B4-1-4]|uniref:ABC transporter permease n=1 Tax=Mesorhizobium sp. B4-1-4 TaxID=2589888 RepID=UPI00112626A5|nr:ABC transporter permease [Mesorhizobium sp. B4-1-4]UCI31822.1 ABC transporter permease [Mesorhizobium sp. B4-1-4]UCI31934.1 ABC transporter permease [Mesorhizobium sp. B4-1-4]
MSVSLSPSNNLASGYRGLFRRWFRAVRGTSSNPVSRQDEAQAAPANRWGWLVLPALIFLVLFFIWPLAFVVVQSFVDPSPGFANYIRLVSSPIVGETFLTTIETALVATFGALLIGYPYSYLMYISSARVATILQLAVLIPSWVSFIVRTYALTVLLRDTGVVNTTLIDLGVISTPLPLIRNNFSVMFGILAVLLPFMVFPIFAVMRRISHDYSRAAAILGAGPVRTFVRIILPLSMPGVLAGCVLVFVIGLGFYITPALLGSGRDLYVAQQVVIAVQHVEWGYGSAISVALLCVTFTVLIVASAFVRFRDVFGVGVSE